MLDPSHTLSYYTSSSEKHSKDQMSELIEFSCQETGAVAGF